LKKGLTEEVSDGIKDLLEQVNDTPPKLSRIALEAEIREKECEQLRKLIKIHVFAPFDKCTVVL